jgi:hypothetical protein
MALQARMDARDYLKALNAMAAAKAKPTRSKK